MSAARILSHIRDNDPDGGSTRPTEQDYADFDAWIVETYGRQALADYRGWGRSEDTPYDPTAEDDIPGAAFHLYGGA